MANSRELQGSARDAHVELLAKDLNRASERLGIPIGPVVDLIGKSSEMAAFSGAYLRVESGVWACDATIYVKCFAEKKSALGFYAQCEVTWGSYCHRLSSATVAIGVYQRAVEMAAIIEGLIS